MSGGRRNWFLVVIGLGGLAALLTLGSWQVQRLNWKTELIATLEARLAEAPLALSGAESVEADNFRQARALGAFREAAGDPRVPARFLTSKAPYGPGFRAITPFRLENGVEILVDRGFTPDQQEIPAPMAGTVELVGALHWPREVGGFTPEPAVAAGRWFARDVPRLAEALGTAPVMLVLSEPPGLVSGGAGAERWPQPSPVTIDLPNNHLGYAVTWYGLAAVWLVMSLALLRRSARPSTI